MKITGDDLERSVGGILSRFGINKDEARKVRKQLNSRIGSSEKQKLQEEADERYFVYFVNRFGMIDLSIEDTLIPTLTIVEQTLYRRLYRLSFCYGRTWCQASHSELQKACNISSEMTIRKGMNGLQDAHCIKMISPSLQRKPPIYRVYLPCEMPQFTGMGIQTGVVFMKEKPDVHKLRELFNSVPDFSELKFSPLIISSLNELRELIFSTENPKISGLKISVQTSNASDNADLEHQKNDENLLIHNIINRSIINNSLSPRAIVDLFYNGIGQTKVSKEKREKAEKDLKELLEDGFSLEDIQFAADWTIKNSKEKPYDFSIIKHTIGQAIADKKEIETKEARKLEEEKLKTQREEEEKRAAEIQERIKTHKENLNEDQRSELREKALEEIRKTEGIKEEFITEFFIEAKENELLGKQLGLKTPE